MMLLITNITILILNSTMCESIFNNFSSLLHHVCLLFYYKKGHMNHFIWRTFYISQNTKFAFSKSIDDYIHSVGFTKFRQYTKYLTPFLAQVKLELGDLS